MSDFTKEEKEYILEMLHNSYDSLVDLEKWEGQDLMTPQEIEDEKRIIDSIAEKLRDEA